MDVDAGVSKASTNTERDEGNQEVAFMIPGVDGKLQFGFPTKIITILRYFDQYGVSSTSGGIGNLIFRMNSPFDPDFTFTGHQPLYWDDYAGIYQSYRVLGSRLTAEISGASLDNTMGPWVWGISGSTNTTSLGTSATNRAEQNDTISSVFNGQQGTQRLSYAFSPEAKLGRPSGDDTVGAAVTTNPAVQYYAHVWFADMNAPASSLARFRIGIEYTIEFYGLLNKASS